MVRILEGIGVVGSYLFFQIRFATGDFNTTFYLYLFLAATYLWVRGCDLYPWYPDAETPPGYTPRQVGIRVHFLKALVPTSYLLGIVSFLCLLGIESLSFTATLAAGLCMVVVASVNGILIWFHRFDQERLPVNYFSLGKYKEGVL